LPCPGELLVEEHHSNYGEPWAGGRDVFEFLADASALTPTDQVLEIGCGTLRVGLHFIRFLEAGRFHCLERDELSLMAALRYELPAQGLLYKSPMIVRGDDMVDFSKFGDAVMYDLIYASAVFLHVPDKLVWTGLERLAGKLRPQRGRIFVSHNVKFCSRLGGDECRNRGLNMRGSTLMIACYLTTMRSGLSSEGQEFRSRWCRKIYCFGSQVLQLSRLCQAVCRCTLMGLKLPIETGVCSGINSSMPAKSHEWDTVA
jgi:SAM-dependent methyltransferase